MGKRDKGHRETKKAKKDTRKISASTALPSTIAVEVIKKGKREAKAGEE